CGHLLGLKAGVAEDTFFRLARGTVEIHLLIRAAGDAHPPTAALLLVDQNNAILSALVNGALRASREAAWVQAMIADTRQIKKDDVLQFEKPLPLFIAESLEIRVVCGVDIGAAQVIIPVRARFDIHLLSGERGHRYGHRLIISTRRIKQVI